MLILGVFCRSSVQNDLKNGCKRSNYAKRKMSNIQGETKFHRKLNGISNKTVNMKEMKYSKTDLIEKHDNPKNKDIRQRYPMWISQTEEGSVNRYHPDYSQHKSGNLGETTKTTDKETWNSVVLESGVHCVAVVNDGAEVYVGCYTEVEDVEDGVAIG